MHDFDSLGRLYKKDTDDNVKVNVLNSSSTLSQCEVGAWPRSNARVVIIFTDTSLVYGMQKFRRNLRDLTEISS